MTTPPPYSYTLPAVDNYQMAMLLEQQIQQLAAANVNAQLVKDTAQAVWDLPVNSEVSDNDRQAALGNVSAVTSAVAANDAQIAVLVAKRNLLGWVTPPA